VDGLLHARTALGVGREQPEQHGGQQGARVGGRHDRTAGDAVQHREVVVRGAERRAALDGVVERGAEREDVGGETGVLAAGDLGGEEGGGADGAGRGGGGVLPGGTGDAEVGDLDFLVADQHVAGLHVAVLDAVAVRGGQRGGGVAPDAGHLTGWQRALLGDDGREAAGGEVLHDQPRPAVLLHHVVDADGVRVLQARGEAGLAHGPGLRAVHLGVVEAVQCEQLLGRDKAVELLVVGLPDDSHRALADLLLQLVAASDEPAAVLHAGAPVPSDHSQV
jgi:hypothetical protein